MDRRTLFFIIALTLSLFGVNLYFEQGRQESLKAWSDQQKAVKEQKITTLEAEISKRKNAQLPVAKLYSDAQETSLLATGVQIDNQILTLSWNNDLPQTIYSNGKEFKMSFLPQHLGELTIYQQGDQPLNVGELKNFGNYQLELYSPKTGTVSYADYIDGHLTNLDDQLIRLKNELNQERTLPKPKNDAIALLKSPNGYLPVGIFFGQTNQLISLTEIPGLKTSISKTSQFNTNESQDKTEKFYVLETPYQQFVFSNIGGALAEINLPFQSKEDEQSVVKEIEFDRTILADDPQNAHFPSHPYYTPGEPEEHSVGHLGGYYPLIRRDLLGNKSRKAVRIPPRYYAFNIVSEYPELAELVYEVKKFDQNSIVFEATQAHRRITKTFTLEANEQKAPYTLNLAINIEGDSRNLWLTSGIPEVEWISGGPAPSLKYRITRNNKPAVENIDLPSDVMTVTTVNPDWLCNSNGFLGLILDPVSKTDPGYRVEKVSGTIVPSRLGLISDRFKEQEMSGYNTLLPLKATGGTMNFRLFAGPFADSVLRKVDEAYSDPATGYNPDYIACQTFHGWFAFISEPFAKFLFILMNFFHSLTNSWALSIVLLTVALRIMMYPLNAWSAKSMINMQKIAPEVAAIQEKYKKDPKKAQIEIMTLYRERGVNPLSGCLPMLIQMPFLIGMFDLLKSTFELRGASFIPGWIDDLSAPDVLFRWNTPIFFIGNEFHLLPILLGVVMFIQQRTMSTAPTDPSLMTEQQRQQRAMGTIMSVVFTLMFYNFPSGLNIYWLSSMLLGILQQWWTAKRMKALPVSTEVVKKKGQS